MFRKIFYGNSKMHIWETLPDGKRVTEVMDHEIEYYVYDDKTPTIYTDIYGNPVRKCTAKNKQEINNLIECGIRCCETDIPEVVKFLQKRYAGKDLKPDISIFKIGILDIETESDGGFPYANEAKYPINLITIKNLKTKKTYTFGTSQYTGNSEIVDQYKYFETEKEMLSVFVDFFRHCNFDIITGWCVLDFDIRYINNRLKILNIEKSLSPVDSVYEDSEGRISIGGLSVLDYQIMYKEFLKIPMSSYSLNFVSLHEIGEGKLELEGSINTAYKTNWNEFVEYNINDVELVHKLDIKLKLIHLCITLAYQTLIPFEKTISTIPLVEGYLLKILHANNMAMSNRSDNHREEYAGGYCYAVPGFYRDVLSWDFESLYPHVIMQHNISPETLVINPINPCGLIKSPVEGIYYKKDKVGFLPAVVKSIFKNRKMYNTRKKISGLKNKKVSAEKIASRLKLSNEFVNKELQIIETENETTEYYHLQQYVRKILINCFHKDTEILTVDGIKNVRDVKVGEMVYSINPITEELEIKEVEHVNLQYYTGYMNRIKNTTFDECVRPEHKILIKHFKSKKNKFVTSDEFSDRCVSLIPIHKINNQKLDKFIFISDFIDLTKYEGLLLYDNPDLRTVKKILFLLPDLDLKQCNNRKQMAFITNGLTKENIKLLYNEYGYSVYLRPKYNRYCSLQKTRINVESLSKFIGYYISEGSLYKSKEKKYKTKY